VNSTLTGPVAAYLAQVRAELSDLPPGELADVLDDVTGHLSEVAAEFEDEPTAAALQDRLGSPRQYADELRNAAGYPPRTNAPPKVRNGAEAALSWGVVAAIVGPFFLIIALATGTVSTLMFGTLGLISLFGAAYLGIRALQGNDPRIVLDTSRGRKGVESIRGSIDQIPPSARRELVTIGQPVWWVARGVVGGGAIFAIFGATAVTVVGALVGAVVSVWIGRKTQQDRRWLWYVVPLNVVAAIIVPVWLAFSFVGGSSFGVFHDGSRYDNSNSAAYSPDGLTLNGQSISNIYPFDEQGRQVKVRLYDENGTPINLQLQDCQASYGQNDRDTLSNFFPQATIAADPDGVADPQGSTDPETCKDTDKAPFVPPPAPATTPATPTAGTTPVPTSTPPATPSAPVASSKPTPSGKPGVTLTVSPTR
jgi:hypothetical protein